MNPKSIKLVLCIAIISSLVAGCAARELIERQSTTLAKANLGPSDNYAVAVKVKKVQPKSMHGGLVTPLAGQVAQILNAELGVNAAAVDHNANGGWANAQVKAASASKPEGRRFLKLDRTAPYSAYFRESGYNGYALFTFDEITDGFSRNELDYSVRGTLALRAFATNEDGDTEKLLMRISIPETVCSRQLYNPPKPGEMVNFSGGYYLSNPDRCLRTLSARVREQVQALLE